MKSRKFVLILGITLLSCNGDDWVPQLGKPDDTFGEAVTAVAAMGKDPGESRVWVKKVKEICATRKNDTECINVEAKYSASRTQSQQYVKAIAGLIQAGVKKDSFLKTQLALAKQFLDAQEEFLKAARALVTNAKPAEAATIGEQARSKLSKIFRSVRDASIKRMTLTAVDGAQMTRNDQIQYLYYKSIGRDDLAQAFKDTLSGKAIDPVSQTAITIVQLTFEIIKGVRQLQQEKRNQLAEIIRTTPIEWPEWKDI